MKVDEVVDEFSFLRGPSGVWTVENASPEMLRESLLTLEAAARDAGAPVDRLAPGISGNQINDVFAAHNLNCPEELLVWFGWRNGYREEDHSAGYALPDMQMRPAASCAESGRVNNTTWVRLTTETYGLVVDLGTPPGELLRAGNIAEGESFYPGLGGESGNEHRADSLCTVVAWWIVGIRNGGYVWSGNSWFGWRPRLDAAQREAGF